MLSKRVYLAVLAALLVTIFSSCATGRIQGQLNSGPKVTSIVIEPEFPRAGEQFTITVLYEDADPPVFFNWIVGGGSKKTFIPSANFTLDSPGSFEGTVSLTDGQRRTVGKSFVVVVGLP